jgi:hypothetical protein
MGSFMSYTCYQMLSGGSREGLDMWHIMGRIKPEGKTSLEGPGLGGRIILEWI